MNGSNRTDVINDNFEQLFRVVFRCLKPGVKSSPNCIRIDGLDLDLRSVEIILKSKIQSEPFNSTVSRNKLYKISTKFLT